MILRSDTFGQNVLGGIWYGFLTLMCIGIIVAEDVGVLNKYLSAVHVSLFGVVALQHVLVVVWDTLRFILSAIVLAIR